MGERCNRTAEVRGSIPLSSTSPGALSSLQSLVPPGLRPAEFGGRKWSAGRNGASPPFVFSMVKLPALRRPETAWRMIWPMTVTTRGTVRVMNARDGATTASRAATAAIPMIADSSTARATRSRPGSATTTPSGAGARTGCATNARGATAPHMGAARTATRTAAASGVNAAGTAAISSATRTASATAAETIAR